MQNDKLTGEKFEAMRSTQRFVKPANRIKYHNQQASKKRLEMQPTFSAINNNYIILKKLISENKDSRFIFSRVMLNHIGYKLKYITHLLNHNDELAYGIYEVEFSIDDKNLKIIRYGGIEVLQ